MFDFVLSFVKNGADYLICAESPFLAGQAPPVPFRKDAAFQPDDTPSLLTRDINVLADSFPEPQLMQVHDYPIVVAENRYEVKAGQALFHSAFAGEVGELFRRARELARQERSGLRILIKSWHEPDIHNFPWELLHDGRRFLAQSTETPVVRFLEQRRPIREFRIEPPLRLLLTTACPAGCGDPLDILEEERRIRTALSPLHEQAVLVVEHQVSLERLRFLLYRARSQGRPFQVWHHAGHGGLGSGRFYLPLTNRDGSIQRSTVPELTGVLGTCEELRLAVLNVCSGATTAGLATALAELNIPAVIGFREKILDDSALTFAEILYKGLTETTLERAVSRARLELRDAGFSADDWSYPLLFARTTGAGPWM